MTIKRRMEFCRDPIGLGCGGNQRLRNSCSCSFQKVRWLHPTVPTRNPELANGFDVMATASLATTLGSSEILTLLSQRLFWFDDDD